MKNILLILLVFTVFVSYPSFSKAENKKTLSAKSTVNKTLDLEKRVKFLEITLLQIEQERTEQHMRNTFDKNTPEKLEKRIDNLEGELDMIKRQLHLYPY